MAVDVLDTILRLSGLGAYLTGFRQISTSVSEASDRHVQFHAGGVAAMAGLGATSIAIASGLRTAVREAGEFEGKVTAFSRLFGGEHFAKEFLQDIREFSGESTFTFKGSVQFAQRLRAMGFQANEIIPIMRDLGDAVAATGGGHDELGRVVLAFGQIRTRGKLAQQEINQLSQANIPAMEILQEKLGLTAEQMKAIGNAGIDADTALAALRAGFQERWGGQMEAFLESMPGRIHQLKNQWEIFRLEIGKPLVPGVKGLTDTLGILTKFAADRPAIGGGIGGAGLAMAGITGAMSLNAMARMSGMAMMTMGKATGTQVSPLTGGLARGGLMGGFMSLVSSNPDEFAKVAESNAQLRAQWEAQVAQVKEDNKQLGMIFREETKQVRAKNAEIRKEYTAAMRSWNKEYNEYRQAARRAASKGTSMPRFPASLIGTKPELNLLPLPGQPVPFGMPAQPMYGALPPVNRRALMGGIGAGLLMFGGAAAGGMLMSHAQDVRNPRQRWGEAFAGGALTLGSTGAMMGWSLGGPYGALGAGVIGALIGGFSSASGIGKFRDTGSTRQEAYQREQLSKLDKIHEAIIEGNMQGQITSQVLAGGEDVRRPFPQGRLVQAIGEGI